MEPVRNVTGLGTISEIDIKKIIPDRTKSIRKGGIVPLGEYKTILDLQTDGSHRGEIRI